MEREILLTGVGGQGVQLAARVLGGAALYEGREVMLLGTYGGTMRGGSTASTLIVADAPIETPPVVAHAWSALAMHHQFFGPVLCKLRPGAVVMVNAGVFAEEAATVSGPSWVRVPAARLAAELGAPLAASLVLAGAFAAATRLVSLDALLAALAETLPPYRRQHLDVDSRALETGYAASPAGVALAWEVPVR